ncbi:MAG: hypothetical protein EPN75_14090 [Beijerinckiaceae bacterium]|nr:MAG: hypothetical protein EPN75_14090 [Beijerinckiaceae bacterium]
MTSIRTSFAPLALALGLALAAAAPVGFGATAQAASAQQAAAQASSGVRCFMSAHTDAQHESTGGWVCFPQYHSSSARQS